MKNLKLTVYIGDETDWMENRKMSLRTTREKLQTTVFLRCSANKRNIYLIQFLKCNFRYLLVAEDLHIPSSFITLNFRTCPILICPMSDPQLKIEFHKRKLFQNHIFPEMSKVRSYILSSICDHEFETSQELSQVEKLVLVPRGQNFVDLLKSTLPTRRSADTESPDTEDNIALGHKTLTRVQIPSVAAF